MIEVEVPDEPVRRPGPLRGAALVPTSLGGAGVVFEAPPGPAPVGMLILQGLETNRSGVNAVWTRTARALAAVGVASFRVDYPGIGDSAGIPGGRDSHRLVLAEVAAWFRASTGLERIGAIAACYGARLVLSLAATGELDGPVALVTPALGRPLSQHLVGRVRRRVRRRLGRSEPLDRTVAADLVRVAERDAVTVLLGERDWQTAAALVATRRHLRPRAVIREEVVPDERLHAFPTARGQHEAIVRLTRWAGSAILAAAAAEPRDGG